MVKEKRKVAKVTVCESIGGYWRFMTVICNVNCSQGYPTRAAALRSAGRFCKEIGREMIVVK
jgi:hypothetical protein